MERLKTAIRTFFSWIIQWFVLRPRLSALICAVLLVLVTLLVLQPLEHLYVQSPLSVVGLQETWLFRIAGVVVCILFGVITYLVMSRQARLTESVRQRTAELTHELNEHRRTEEALRESQRAMLTLMSNLPGMAYRCRNDRDWTMEFVSEGCVMLTGYAAVDLAWNTSITYNDLIHPDDQEIVWHQVQEALRQRIPYVVEYRIHTAIGEWRHVSDQGMGVFKEDVLQAREGLIIDVTERRLTQQAVAESEEKYHTLFESSVQAVLLETPDRQVLDCNQAACDLYGYDRGELIGMSAYNLLPDEAQHFIDQLIQLELSEGGGFIHSMDRRKDGSIFPVEVSTRLVTLQGEARVIVFVRDVTERYQREREQGAIAALASALRSAMTQAEIAPVILDQLLDLLHAQAGAVFIYDMKVGEAICTLGIGAWERWTGTRRRSGEGPVGNLLHINQPYLNNDIYQDESLADVPREIKAMAGVPMVIQGQVYGALWLGRNTALSEGEMRLLTAFADLAAGTLHRAALHEETQRRIQRMAALHYIDVTINSILDLTVILTVVLEQVANQLEVDAAAVWLFDRDLRKLQMVNRHGFNGQDGTRHWLRLGEGTTGLVAFQRRSKALADLRRESNLPQYLIDEQFITYHAVPLIAKGELKGVLEVFHRSLVSPTPEWLEFFETLAGQAAIAIDNASMFETLERSNMELELAYDTTLEGWARAMELRDRETEGHTRRVVNMTLKLVSALGMPEQQMAHVRRGALLHDIGKLGIPDHILLKPGPLTDEEWEIMRMHPVYAYQLLAPIAYLSPALDIPYGHHEHWNGSGYPRSLKGEEIPLGARAFAVVDIWDALISSRTYREGWTPEHVREYISGLAGNQLDPQVVDTFLRMLDGEIWDWQPVDK
jgi:PAS domain S-box-containing protein